MAEYESKIVVKADVEQAEAAAKRLRGNLALLERATVGVSRGAMGLVRNFAVAGLGAVGLGVGLGALGRKVLEANIELEQTEKKVAGAIFAFTRWKEGVAPVNAYRASLAEAKRTTEEFEEAENRFAIGSEVLGQTFASLAPQLSRYGVDVQKQRDISISAAAAAKVLGVDSGRVGFIMAQALRGVPPTRDPISQLFFRSKQEVKEFQRLRPEERLAHLEKRLSAMRGPAEEASKGFEGAMFRIRDFVSDTVRDVGKPAFDFIVKKIDEWRMRLAQTVEGGKTLGQVLSERILKTTQAITSAIEFMARHWKEIAVAVGGLKLAGLAGSVASLGSGLAGAAASARILAAVKFPHLVGIGAAVGFAGAKAFEQTAASDWLAKRLFGFDAKRLAASEAMVERLSAAPAAEFSTEDLPRFLAKPGEKFDREKWFSGLRVQDLSKPGAPHIDFRGSQFKINQEFKQADPDNVYVRFKEDVASEAEARLSSRLSETFGPTG